MTRVLVTGGLGFLGSHLVDEFAGAGFEVRILNRLGRRKHPLPHPRGHEIIWADIRDAGAVDTAVHGCDLVIHTVSNFREAKTDSEAYPINVGGTENLLAAAENHRPKRVIICSTIGVHGNVADVPSSEESPYRPGDIYQETKVVVETRAREFERKSGIPVVILRPASLYGPGDLRMLKLFRMIQRRRFVMMGKGDSFFHPAYIDDVARGFLLAATHPAAGGETFIIGGDTYLPLRELIERIARRLGVAPPGLALPLGPFELLARACEAVCAPFGLEPPLHRRRMSFFRNNRAFTIAKAQRILGYQPSVSLEAGLERTIRWYEANGLVEKRSGSIPAMVTPAPGDPREAVHSADTRQSSR